MGGGGKGLGGGGGAYEPGLTSPMNIMRAFSPDEVMLVKKSSVVADLLAHDVWI